MARLLAAGSFSQTIAEGLSQQKLVAQYIHRELREADEANLLDEEDMHVFDLKPMDDPLDLVCCNSCKKPLKASQYAAHAELCKTLTCLGGVVSEPDAGAGNKKPQRRERKKLLSTYVNQAIKAGEQELSECRMVDETAVSEVFLDDQIRMNTLSTVDGKSTALVMDDSGVGPGNTDYSAGVMKRPSQHTKLLAAEHPLPYDLQSATGITKKLCTSSQEANSYVPVPLATKIYYCQRSDLLRSDLARLYHESSSKEYCSILVGAEVVQPQDNSMMPSHASLKNYSYEQIADQPDSQNDRHYLLSPQNSNHTPAHCAEVACSPPMNFSHESRVHNNFSKGQTDSVGMLKGKYMSKPYSFAGNSGNQEHR